MSSESKKSNNKGNLVGLILISVFALIKLLSCFEFFPYLIGVLLLLSLLLLIKWCIEYSLERRKKNKKEKPNVTCLSCPSCGASVKVLDDKIHCSRCGHTENIIVTDFEDDGVIDKIVFPDREVHKNTKEPLVHTEVPGVTPVLFTYNTSTISKKETVPEAFVVPALEVKTNSQPVVPVEEKDEEQNEYYVLALKAFEKNEIKYFLRNEYGYRLSSTGFGSIRDWNRMADGILKAFEEFGDASVADKLNDTLEELMNGFTEDIYYAFSILSALLKAEDDGCVPKGFKLDRERLLNAGAKAVKYSEYSLKINTSGEGKNDSEGLYGVVMKSYAAQLLTNE